MRLKSNTSIIIAIIGFIGIVLSAIITAKCNQQHPPSNVISGGNQNSIIISDSGDITLTQGVSKQDVIDALQITINELRSDSSAEIEIKRLKERLAKIHDATPDSPSQEADKWAEHFITSLPIREDKVTEQAYKLKQRNEFINKSIPYLFEYMISFIDQRVSALKSRMPGIVIKKTELKEFFIDKRNITQKAVPNVCVREISFNNGKGFKINIIMGIIDENEVVKRPEFAWSEIKCKKCNKFILLSECFGGFGGPSYCYLRFINDDLVIEIDKLDKLLTSKFEELMENVLLIK